MKLINTDGMALIGPGSEWLWTAVSGIVLAITFLAIYRQLRLQRGAAAREQITSLRREWRGEPMVRRRVAYLVGLRDGRDPLIFAAEAEAIGDFWDETGSLVRSGHLDRRLLWDNLGVGVMGWWAWLAPSALAWREKHGSPGVWEHFEWLAGEMREMSRRAGRPGDYWDEAHRARALPEMIEMALYEIRAFEEMRTVIVRPPSPAPLAPQPMAEPAVG